MRPPLVSCAAGLVAAASATAISFESERAPNVIVIIADDLPRDLSTYLPEGRGRALMPTLEMMASEGTVLANMRSPSAVCTPSRFALLTGTYPSRCQHPHFLHEAERDGQPVVQFNTHLLEGQETLATRFRRAGYATGAVGKNHVIAVEDYERLPYDADPFNAETAAKLASNAKALERAFNAAGFDYAAALYHGNPDADGIRALAVHNQEWVTAAALDFIDDHREDPFFLLMSTTLTHGPYGKDRSIRADPRITAEGMLDAPPRVQAPRETIEERLSSAGIDGFNTCNVLWLDDAVRAIRDRLARHEIDDETVVVFLSDHGMGAKGTTYEAAGLTSAFLWHPGGPDLPPAVSADLSLVDIAPTLLDLAGIAFDRTGFDGSSFAPVLAGERDSVREVVYSEIGYSRAVQRGRYKYIALRYPEYARTMPMAERRERLEASNKRLRERGIEPLTEDPAAAFSHLFLIPGGHDTDRIAITKYPGYFDADQLYDLEVDPDEQMNLADDPAYATVLRDLKAELDAIITDLPGTFGEFGRGGEQTP